MILKLELVPQSLGELVKMSIASHPPSPDSESAGPVWGPKVCISNKFLGDSHVAGQGPHFEN